MFFSVFAPSANFKRTRIMLGPASFVNHEGNLNARFVVSSEKKTKRSYQLRQSEQLKLTTKFQFSIAIIFFESLIRIVSATNAAKK